VLDQLNEWRWLDGPHDLGDRLRIYILWVGS
jgi:hypothetical protein